LAVETSEELREKAGLAMTRESQLRDGETLTVGIVLYEGVEELDFVGPYETFKASGYQAARLRGLETRPVTVFTVAERPGPLATSGGLRIIPDYSFAATPAIDLLIIPGGNVGPQIENAAMQGWLMQVTAQARINSSVCNGALILGKTGLLDGHTATTHWGSLDRLAELYPSVTVKRDVRWVDEGSVVTAAGVSAGIDMSLHLVERLLGRDVAEDTAHYMEYRWNED
jgi:transcriptional regulator GlxA family with amidase domain